MTPSPSPHDKILSLEDLAQRLEARGPGQRVVQCQGDFEVLHPGYIRYLEEARQMGDLLVVTLTPDHLLPRTYNFPSFDGRLRAEAVAALSMVDYVAVSPESSPAKAIQLLRPNVFLHGGEADPLETAPVEDALRNVGGSLALARTRPAESTTVLMNPLSAYSPEVTRYLEDFSSRYSTPAVLKWLEGGRRLKVLVVGEAIIDEYHYCETMGKSGKEPILATRYLRTETFAGGILAVANHVAAFTDQVDVLTILGRQNGQPDPTEPFIREHLNAKVRPVFLYQDEAPTIVKRRFVESYPLQKLFEVYLIKHMEEDCPLAEELCARLEALVADYDVVIVTDYGHGMLVPKAVEILCRKARFLAVNTQTNADNQGFNTISKYPRADFVSLSERELRLEVRSRSRSAASIMEEVAGAIGCRTLLITRGQKGNLLYSPAEGFSTSPSLSNRILDRVGAGDAVLSVASLCVAQGAPLDVVGFIGNAVGAQAVAIVGHRTSLDSRSLSEYIAAILG